MKYVVLPLMSHSQNAPGVAAGFGFRFNAAHSGKSLSVSNMSLLTADSTHQFRLEGLGGSDAGHVRIVHVQTGRVVEIANASSSAGAPCRLADWSGATHQQFRVVGRGGASVTLTARHSGLVVSVDNAALGTGSRIVQSPASGGGHQTWNVTMAVVPPVRSYVLAAVHSGLVAAEVDGKLRVRQQEWNDDLRQTWQIIALSGEHVGSFMIRCPASGRVMAIKNAIQSPGARIQLQQWNAGEHQKFILVGRDNGRVSLLSQNGLVLEVEGTSKSEGTGLVLAPWSEHAEGQVWQMSRVHDGASLSGLQVTVHTERDFKGRSQKLGPGFWNLSDLTLGNDNIRSIRIPDGMRVTAYEHMNFGGEKRYYRLGDKPYLYDFQDRISSIFVDMVATIYRDANFQGGRQAIGVGMYNGGFIQIQDNNLSSLKVPPGLIVTLYERADFTGKHWVFTEDSAALGALNDVASSIVVEQMGLIVPKEGVRFGSKLALRLARETRYLYQDTNGLVYVSGSTSPSPASRTFTLVRSGISRYKSLVTFGDVVSLQAPDGRYLSCTKTWDGSTVQNLQPTISDNERFVVERTGTSKNKHFLSASDTISLRAIGNGNYAQENAISLVFTDPTMGEDPRWDDRRWMVLDLELPAGVDVGGVCGAEACLVDACATAACGADAALIRVCGTATSTFTICSTEVCGAASCTVAAAQLSACGSDSCTAAGCGIATSVIGNSMISACGAALGGIDACGADICGANACGINVCLADACAVDACGVDIVPGIPLI